MNQELKDREHASWTQVAPGWKTHDATLAVAYQGVTDRMLQNARVGAGMRIVDVACGAGEPGLTAAAQVGPDGHVLAIDFVEEMLEAARAKAARLALKTVTFRRADGENLELEPGSFDAALSRWGLMYMPEPVACLRQVHQALRSGARLAVACWSGPDKNPWVSLIMKAIKQHIEVPSPAPGAPNLFALADPSKLRSVLEDAGFADVNIEPVAAAFPASSSGRAHFAFVRELAAPITRLAARLSPEQFAAVESELDGELERFRTPDGLVIPGESWVASARK